jgi:hypothetical protein
LQKGATRVANHRLSPYPNSRFSRAALPLPETYYRREGLRLIGHSGEWRSALCVFHPDKTPSLRVNVKTGAFRCMACDASGCDVLAFHRQRHGLDFVAAARDLGAWNEVR